MPRAKKKPPATVPVNVGDDLGLDGYVTGFATTAGPKLTIEGIDTWLAGLERQREVLEGQRKRLAELEAAGVTPRSGGLL